MRSVLDKVRLVANLCRVSTNFQEELQLAARQMKARVATRETREPVEAPCIFSRFIIDCQTRWGLALVMVRRLRRVGGAVLAALFSCYQYKGVPFLQKLVHCPTLQEQEALDQLVNFLTVVESASTSFGSESTSTSSIEKAVYWYVRRAAEPHVKDCLC